LDYGGDDTCEISAKKCGNHGSKDDYPERVCKFCFFFSCKCSPESQRTGEIITEFITMLMIIQSKLIAISHLPPTLESKYMGMLISLAKHEPEARAIRLNY
jgi:hypothetical protein